MKDLSNPDIANQPLARTIFGHLSGVTQRLVGAQRRGQSVDCPSESNNKITNCQLPFTNSGIISGGRRNVRRRSQSRSPGGPPWMLRGQGFKLLPFWQRWGTLPVCLTTLHNPRAGQHCGARFVERAKPTTGSPMTCRRWNRLHVRSAAIRSSCRSNSGNLNCGKSLRQAGWGRCIAHSM